MKPFSPVQWVSWISASIAAALTLSTFAYTHFESKDHAQEVKDSIIKRLERIEDKLDKVLSN